MRESSGWNWRSVSQQRFPGRLQRSGPPGPGIARRALSPAWPSREATSRVSCCWNTASARDLIFGMASKHRLPAIYANRLFVTGGGLLSYISDRIDQVRRAAGYVDRILRGEKAANLPVQAPTKYELVINLKTAKALGLNVPAALLARADAVIE